MVSKLVLNNPFERKANVFYSFLNQANELFWNIRILLANYVPQSSIFEEGKIEVRKA